MMPNADAGANIGELTSPLKSATPGSCNVGGSGTGVASPVDAAPPDFLGLGPSVGATSVRQDFDL
jgi:hypothetical protein